jgi:hypothetical protein
MRPRFASAGHTLLGEPLDGAGNRGSGFWLQQAQVRGLRRTRPCARGFPSVACDAPLAWFAAAACVPPQPGRTHGSPQGASERRDCERRDALQKVKRARSVTAAQLAELRGYARTMWKARFSTASNRSAGSECALRRSHCLGAKRSPASSYPSTVSGRWRRCSREFPGSLDGT